ncbi:uncharacterized protein [Aegilops tauschii subsp. strangulata]|uniref:uncharacterized protein n=1 Tax=Aegilops tauschii subsp. strangulata TaxID=200361 RepID=UPI003CC89464
MTDEWEASFPQYQLSPASTHISDHCPIVLKRMECSHYKAFRFENHWLNCTDFQGVVHVAWNREVKSNDPIRVLHTKLSRTAQALRLWNMKKVRWANFMSNLASEVIFRLDLAQEERDLSAEERRLRASLKAKLLGLAAIDRAKWRQKSRLTEIREGDANTRFFQIRASGRRRKNHIPSLSGRDGMVTDHEGKAQILFDRFKGIMGTPFSRTTKLNWEAMGLPRRDLQHLDNPFTEHELHAAVTEMHGEKAPGPDGFTGMFFKHCWQLIKEDLLAAVNSVQSLRGHN